MTGRRRFVRWVCWWARALAFRLFGHLPELHGKATVEPDEVEAAPPVDRPPVTVTHPLGALLAHLAAGVESGLRAPTSVYVHPWGSVGLHFAERSDLAKWAEQFSIRGAMMCGPDVWTTSGRLGNLSVTLSYTYPDAPARRADRGRG